MGKSSLGREWPKVGACLHIQGIAKSQCGCCEVREKKKRRNDAEVTGDRSYKALMTL